MTRLKRGVLVAVLSAAIALASCGGRPDDYAFEASPAEVAVGQSVRVAVRVEGPSGVVALTPEAVASARLGMVHEGMAPMSAALRSIPAAEGESLAWEADVSMAGPWTLDVTASVPGVDEPVSAKVTFNAEE